MERDFLMIRFLVGCLVLAVLNVAEVEPEEDVLPDADDEVRAGRCNQFRHVPGCKKGAKGAVRAAFSKLNSVAFVRGLNVYGIESVYVDKNIIGKLTGRFRVRSSNVIQKLNAVLSPPYVSCAPYTENGVKRINVYKKINGNVQYVVIDLDGRFKGNITTYVRKATASHLKQKGLSYIP